MPIAYSSVQQNPTSKFFYDSIINRCVQHEIDFGTCFSYLNNTSQTKMADIIVQLNTTRNGRDKIFRTLQYALKAINNYPYLASEKSRDLEKTLASFRKLLRFGTFFDAILSARASIHSTDLLHGTLITLARVTIL